ncbi:MAG: hypothetical protein IJ374_13125 [Lachnospiraceae bacterium]|nr:hypothetical protein [Lachnospiraceae bacterium]MBQ8813034.1 hypothetical protein [Lachnospiraceae bacterium]
MRKVVCDEADYESFVEKLGQLPFYDTYILFPMAIDPNFSYYGYVVKIEYEDGSYETVAESGYQEVRAVSGKSRNRHYSCDDEIWNSFVTQFLDQ